MPSSVSVTRSVPSRSTCPEMDADLRLIRPMIAWLVTLLPEPDSPTMASVWLRSRLKLTPSTAWTMPSSVGNSTLRSVTSR